MKSDAPSIGRRVAAVIQRHPVLACAAVGVVGFALSAAIAVVAGMPYPRVFDESSYLFAADTFAHGRVANPAHPLWRHFEALNVVSYPAFVSKYPPTQGLILALGQLLGHPAVGLWLSIALMAMAIVWMLRAVIPARWAVAGGLIAIVQFGLVGRAVSTGVMGYWSQSYWGGAMAAMGGALLFGGVFRAARRPTPGAGLAIGIGLGVLANSRPLEGLMIALPAIGVLMARWWHRRRTQPNFAAARVIRFAAPLLLVLLLTGVAMAYYNYRGTGSPLRMPYKVYEEAYSRYPLFFWQKMLPPKAIDHADMHHAHNQWEVDLYLSHRAWGSLLRAEMGKVLKPWAFYLGWWLTPALLALPWAWRRPWVRFAVAACAWMLFVGFNETSVWPHYLAPMAGLVVLIVVQCLRSWRRMLRGFGLGNVGRFAPAVVAIAGVGIVIACFPLHVQDRTYQRKPLKPKVARELSDQGGRHLVLVHLYHDETWEPFFSNSADLDHAPIVWARDLGPERDRALFDYFKDRRVWLLELGPNDSWRLMPYGERVTTQSTQPMTQP